MIQEQNDRILQLEEKLAVANQLDNKKNDVLSKIKDAFDIVSGRCQKFETDSSKLNEMLQNADQRLAAKVVNYQKVIQLQLISEFQWVLLKTFENFTFFVFQI